MDLHPSVRQRFKDVVTTKCGRSREIQLASKRKFRFVLGTITRSTTDEYEGTQWDTCNNMVISWLHNNICESIRKSTLFISSTNKILKATRKTFLVN